MRNCVMSPSTRCSALFFALLVSMGVVVTTNSGRAFGANDIRASGSAVRPIVYAHYMHCYILGAMTDGDLQGRQAPPDVVLHPEAWPLSERTERSWWSAPLAPLAQAGKAGVVTDFARAEAAGLDALALLIGPQHLPNSAYAAGMRLAAEVASESKVKLIPDLWDNWDLGSRRPSREELVEYGRTVKKLMDEHPGAFLTYHGRPVISLGNPLRNGSEIPFRWGDYKAVFDPWGGPKEVYLILNTRWETDDLGDDWGQAVDALSTWAAAQGWGDRQTNVLLSLTRRYQKALAWPVSPAFYGGRQGTDNIAESLGASRFIDQWRRSIELHAPFVVIQSWNDFSEDHAITETNYRGTTLIELNRHFADWIHSGAIPSISRDTIYLFHHRQLIDARLSEPTMHALNDSWHVTPTTDYLDVVTILRRPGKVLLRSGEYRWLRWVPAGLHEWLVYVPSRNVIFNSVRKVRARTVRLYPTDSAEHSVSIADAISEGNADATLMQDDSVQLEVRSRIPIADHGRWQDLSLVGNMASR